MRKLTFLFALLCASVMAWAYTSEPNTWIGTTDPTYANQFKWLTVDAVAPPSDVVNIQQVELPPHSIVRIMFER